MKILKSKVAGMTDLQYTKRAKLIKQVAEKRANKAKVEARRWSNVTEKTSGGKRNTRLDTELSRMDDNHNHYTDGEKYLAEHYGDRLADQTSYESNEGWN